MQTENPNQSINDCIEIQKKINKALIDKDFHAKRLDIKNVQKFTETIKNLNTDFNNQKCSSSIGKMQQQQLEKIANDYKEVDKIRIETESIRQRNKKIIVGGGILIVGLGLLLTINKIKK
jgi:hypothetical protein